MWGPGGLSCLIRFVCHIPTGLVGPATLAKFVSARGLGDLYDVIPHGRTFLRGMGVVGVAGTLTFVWNFFQFMASPFCRGYLLGLIGVFDLILAVVLITGVAMQGQFLPGTYARCNGASTWSNAADGRNFFVTANATGNFSTDGPDSVCHVVMQDWVLAIVVIIFYLLCGIANVLIGFHYSEPGTVHPWGSFSQYDVDQVPMLFRGLRFLGSAPHRAYERLAHSVHITLRYTSKYRARNTNLTPHKVNNPELVMAEKPILSSTSLQLPRYVIIKIAEDLHTSDLVNLSRSSKHLRTVFFGTDNPQQALNELRRLARCRSSSFAHCAVCNMRICRDCGHKALVPRLQAFDHLTNCRPACSRCFFKDYCGKKSRSSRTDEQGDSRGSSGRIKHIKGWFASRSTSAPDDLEMQHGGGEGAEAAQQRVCGNCSKMSRQEMLEALDGHNLLELQRQARMPLACFGCEQTVRVEGVRWWVDSRTGRECRWVGHPGWVKEG